MRLTRFSDVASFAARAQPFLMEREAEHCLAIGILTTLLRSGMSHQRAPYLALVEADDGRVLAVTLATPPFNLILSHIAPAAEAAETEILHLIGAAARDAALDLPGVIGPTEIARQFIAEWGALTGQSARVDVHERIYRLERVRLRQPVAGAMRRIEEGDRPLLRAWLRAFWIEALGLPDHPQVEDDITFRLRFETSGMYLWQDGAERVSIAGYGGPTPHGIRIGPVYTPPEARGHGYASALVAALSQRLLDEGRQFVFLFTNLANPTANHIYQEIGYKPVGDVTVYQFQPMA